MLYIEKLPKYFKFLIYFCIKVFFGFFIILVAMYLFWIAYLYFFADRISETDAQNIALDVIKTKYSTICGGNFDKYLEVKIDGYNSKYEYYSDNGECNIFIFIDEYGVHSRGFMPNNAYEGSGNMIPTKK